MRFMCPIALSIAVFVCPALRTNAAEPAKAGAAHVGELRVARVLFLGNSITLHGPAPKIGWEGNWGMAASSREKDYVHLLTARIAKEAGAKPEIKVKNIADFERTLLAYDLKTGLKDELAFEADLVIVAIGENAAPLKTDEAKNAFHKAFVGLLTELKKHGRPTLFVCGCFMTDHAKDEVIKKACEEAGVTYVDNGKLGTEKSNLAGAERKIDHPGVAAHPGDKGMQARADSLWVAIEKRAAKPKP